MTHRLSRIDLQETSSGTARHILVHRFGEPGARPKVYVQASMHADEAPAMLVAHHLLRRLAGLGEAVRGEVVVVPFANPIGLSQRLLALHVGRGDLGVGGNFNRGFADLRRPLATAMAEETAPSPEAVRRTLAALVEALPVADELSDLRRKLLGLAVDANIVLDLHTHYEGTVYMYTNASDPVAADELGVLTGCRVVLVDRGAEPAPGGLSLDQACDLPWRALKGAAPGCLTATLEYRGQADTSDALAEADAEALVQFLMRRGVIDGELTPLPAPLCTPTPVEAVAHLTSPRPGVTLFHRQPGERVAAGDLVAEVVDPASPDPMGQRTPIVAPCDGVLFGRLISRLARPGLVLASIATDDAAKVGRFAGDPYP